MGLDITAYSNLRYIGRHAGDEDQEHGYNAEVTHTEGYSYSDFPHALVGPYKVAQSADVDSFITVGCFEITEKTETHGFRAGSYSGYNRWRDELRMAFNPDTAVEVPFHKLICFADNEGTLLTSACRDLLVDFETHREQWRDHLVSRFDAPQTKHYAELYEDWAHAFKLAAECGLVDFH